MDWKDKYVVLKSYDANFVYLEKDLIEIHPDATFIRNTVLAHQLNKPWTEARDGTSSIDVELSVLLLWKGFLHTGKIHLEISKQPDILLTKASWFALTFFSFQFAEELKLHSPQTKGIPACPSNDWENTCEWKIWNWMEATNDGELISPPSGWIVRGEAHPHIGYQWIAQPKTAAD